jgi:hypothetical protein
MVAEDHIAENSQPQSTEERAARLLGALVLLALLVAAAWWLVGVGLAVLFSVWLAWWVWGVNWPRTWNFLSMGAWAPLILLLVISALAWSQIAPSEWDCLGVLTVRNFWWQLGAVGLLAATALLCGWLQGVLHWQPGELELEPTEEAHDHGHGHGHH